LQANQQLIKGTATVAGNREILLNSGAAAASPCQNIRSEFMVGSYDIAVPFVAKR
jgi:hypothetical protein